MDLIITVGVMILLFLIFLIFSSIKISGPKQKMIVTRRGKYLFTAGDGLWFVIPFIDRVKRINIEEYNEYMKNNYPTISCRKCHSDSIPFDTEKCPYCGKKL